MATTQELITKTKNFVPSETTYGKPRLGNKGGKTFPLHFNGRNLVLQFPLIMTWGCNEWDTDDGAYKKYDLNLQFGDRADDPETSEGYLFQAFQQLQEKVLNDAVTYSKEWFGKSKMSREVAEALMYPILKYPKDKSTGEPDKTRRPTIKLKVPCWEGKFKVELYDMNKNPLYTPNNPNHTTTPPDLIASRSHLKGLMECGGVWHAGGKFGITWKLVQAQVRPPIRIQGFCIMDDSDDDEAEQALETEEAQELGGNNVPSFSSDEEEKPKPKAKVKAKGRKKKKVVRAS